MLLHSRLSFLRHPFIAASGIVLLGSMGANILNYLFNLVAGRLLAPSVYGEAAALVSLAMIVAVPSATLMTLLAKYTATHRARGDETRAAALFHLAHRAAWALGLLLTLILALMAPWVARALHTPLPSVLLFLTFLPLGMANAAVKGALQGAKQFHPYSFATALEAGGKLACGTALMLLLPAPYALVGVIAALIASASASYLYGLAHVRRILSADAHTSPAALTPVRVFHRIPPYAWAVLASSLFIAIFTNSHVVLAKHYLPPLASGHYAALAVLGRIVLYGGGAAAVVLLPMASAGRSKESAKILMLALAVVGAISGIAVGAFALAPHIVIKLLFGPSYLDVAPSLWLMGLGQAFLALATLLVQYFIASHRTLFLLPLALCTLLQAMLISLFHDDAAAITRAVAGTCALLFLSLLPFLFMRTRRTETTLPL